MLNLRWPHGPLATLCLAIGSSSCKPKSPTPAPPPPPVVAPPVVIAPVPPPEPIPAPAPPPLLHFQLPTTNQGLYTNQNELFFMYVKRTNAAKQESKVWQGGQYGFVRDPMMAKDGSIHFTHFHEGMDVAPMIRDVKGEPQDEVRAMADGTVVYANTQAGKSNYGNYVMIEHATEDGPFYSLCAHFREVKVTRGMKVRAGDLLGIMGHTGAGIDRERAHTHVELNFLLNPRAAPWNAPPEPIPAPIPAIASKPTLKPALPGPILNGTNLVGLNIAEWLRVHHAEPATRLADFIRREAAYFKVRVPNRGTELEITQRYPWLREPGAAGLAWEISIGGSGVPLKIAPLAEKVDFPVVSWVQPFIGSHGWNSRGMLSGSGPTATLSTPGLAYLKLLLGE